MRSGCRRRVGDRSRHGAVVIRGDVIHIALVVDPLTRLRLRKRTVAEAGDTAASVAMLSAIPADALIPVALRHQLGGLVSHWLERTAAAGVDVPGTLREPFTRARFASALQATDVIRRVRDVVRRLDDSGIQAIVLKGGARLAAGRSDAQLHYSGASMF